MMPAKATAFRRELHYKSDSIVHVWKLTKNIKFLKVTRTLIYINFVPQVLRSKGASCV